MMKLYSAWYCPFAQRAWISTLHKGLEFDYVETDPYEKTAVWMDISRGSGQVPVLELKNDEGDISRVIDSFRVMEFIDDQEQGNNAAIYPENPQQKAEVKFWMDFIAARIIPYFYRFLKASEAGAAQNDAKVMMLKGLDAFTHAMSAQGPFFMGDTFGAVDIAFAPFAYRIELLLAHYRDFHISNNLANFDRYNTWYQAVIKEPAYIKSSSDQQDYPSRLIQFYLPYSLGGGQSDVTAI